MACARGRGGRRTRGIAGLFSCRTRQRWLRLSGRAAAAGPVCCDNAGAWRLYVWPKQSVWRCDTSRVSAICRTNRRAADDDRALVTVAGTSRQALRRGEKRPIRHPRLTRTREAGGRRGRIPLPGTRRCLGERLTGSPLGVRGLRRSAPLNEPVRTSAARGRPPRRATCASGPTRIVAIGA